MKKIRVSAVKFYNSLPMVYGLKNTSIFNEIELSLDTPADCAHKLIKGEADAGLVPVATIPEIKNGEIFSDYCIGANGKVRTVELMSEVPVEKIEKIVLDSHSRTSVALMRILAKEYLHKDFEFINGYAGFENTEIKGKTAGVVIGDKVFNVEKRYAHIIDLAELWQKFTGGPFVFATWVSNIKLTDDFKQKFNLAVNYGLSHLEDVVKTIEYNENLSSEELLKYLKFNIDYDFNASKKEAMNLFLNKLRYI